MPDPAHLITGAFTRPGKRALTVLAAVLLLAGGLFAYSAQGAPPAHAATVVNGGLDVDLNPGSTDVGLATVSATVTYTCTDPSAPGGQAQLRVDFDQNGNDTSGETSVACGSADTGETQTVTALQLGMSDSLEITAIATLEDGPDDVIAAAYTDPGTDVGQIYAEADPAATFPGDGSVTATGFYNCGSGITGGPIKFIVTAEQEDSSGVVTVGSALIDATCNSTDQPWSVNITGSLTGDAFSGDPGVLVEVTATAQASVKVPDTMTATTATVAGMGTEADVQTYG